MSAIKNLFSRFGLVKLDRYGLILTSDGRILSNRPAVLDDGLGGKIVGWLEGDLAAMELEHWGAARPAAKPIALPRRPPPVRVTQPAPVVAPVTVVAPPQRPLPGIPPMPVVATAPSPPPVVAAPPPVEEDEWEWEIAVARARAAAEWAEEAAAAGPPEPVFTTATFPRTEELPDTWTEDHSEREVIMPIPHRPAAPSYRPIAVTVIPVPRLPSAADPRTVRPAQVARIAPLTPPRRFPRATGRMDDTVRTRPAPANDDHTSPGFAMPPASMRIAAKQR